MYASGTWLAHAQGPDTNPSPETLRRAYHIQPGAPLCARRAWAEVTSPSFYVRADEGQPVTTLSAFSVAKSRKSQMISCFGRVS